MKNPIHNLTALCAASALLSLAAQAHTLVLPYESVFKDYQPHKEVPLQNWKSVNEAVHTAGGWRAYQREAQAPDTAAPNSTATQQDKPATHIHGAQKP